MISCVLAWIADLIKEPVPLPHFSLLLQITLPKMASLIRCQLKAVNTESEVLCQDIHHRIVEDAFSGVGVGVEGVLGLQEWFVSSRMHMNARIQGAAEYCTSTVSVF